MTIDLSLFHQIPVMAGLSWLIASGTRWIIVKYFKTELPVEVLLGIASLVAIAFYTMGMLMTASQLSVVADIINIVFAVMAAAGISGITGYGVDVIRARKNLMNTSAYNNDVSNYFTYGREQSFFDSWL